MEKTFCEYCGERLVVSEVDIPWYFRILGAKPINPYTGDLIRAEERKCPNFKWLSFEHHNSIVSVKKVL